MKRTIVATALLSGLIAAQAASAAPVTVVEYYKPHAQYLLHHRSHCGTANARPGGDFARTGMSFQARSTDDVNLRQWHLPLLCVDRVAVHQLALLRPPGWIANRWRKPPMPGSAGRVMTACPGSEGDGTCPEGATPVYRSFRPVAMASHPTIASPSTAT